MLSTVVPGSQVLDAGPPAGYRGFGNGDGSRGGGAQECYGGQVTHNANSASETDTLIDGWSHASSICLAIGARLCTADELQAEETRGSGCAHDREFIWSSTACDGGHLVGVGGNQWGSDLCGNAAEDGSDECAIDEAAFCITAELLDGGRRVEGLQYEDVCKLAVER